MSISFHQLSLLETTLEVPDIPGLRYLPNYITEAEEAALVAGVEQAGWQNAGMQRLVRQFGIRYSFFRRSVAPEDSHEPLPEWGQAIALRLYQENLMPAIPNQLLANRYLPGEGISFHVDASEFAEIADLSLLSACVMEFRHIKTQEKRKIWLEPRSLLILSDEARWEWAHSIPYRQRDRFNGREQIRRLRISLTYRIL
ncbi:alpha-ketoglutarate-dependent dioxygenase AlkB [Leptothermofonsia sp. ETS-13]|uniref:alpha-ketoglutarate-dependent dioxygenase AlkB n=1 Tax=Leptothermofonsia sp. ETS-13 TaxID=3035696 RepID=UPI003BA2B11D